ncbi:MAG: homoserine dehydrogenase, partial [Dongiaceae bacterium]
MSKPLRVGIAGLGTVGAGTLKLLGKQRDLLAQRCGRAITVTAVSARDRARDRGIDVSSLRWYGDPLELTRAPDVDVVVELIGGSDGVAKHLVETAIANRKQVVTANKALLALHGTALARAAESAGVT